MAVGNKIVALALIAGLTSASAQTVTIPDHSVRGRIGIPGQPGPEQTIPFSVLFAQLLAQQGSPGFLGTTMTLTGSATLQSLFIGTNSPSGDSSGVLIGRNINPANGLLDHYHAFRDETIATQNVTANQFSGYASYDAFPQILGSATTPMNHLRSFQARPYINSAGQLNALEPFWSGPVVDGASTVVSDLLHFHATQPQILNGATVTVQAAFYSDPLSGAGSNFFLMGPNNPSALQGQLYIGGLQNSFAQEEANIRFNGSTQQGLLFFDTFASAGNLTNIQFVRNFSTVGSITTTVSTTAYNTSSDERLKTFHGEYSASEAERVIRADPVRSFQWNDSGDRGIGWGAQTSYKIAPDLATPGDDDMTKHKGDPGFKQWFVEKGARTPYLWAAMGDVLERLDRLERKHRR